MKEEIKDAQTSIRFTSRDKMELENRMRELGFPSLSALIRFYVFSSPPETEQTINNQQYNIICNMEHSLNNMKTQFIDIDKTIQDRLDNLMDRFAKHEEQLQSIIYESDIAIQNRLDLLEDRLTKYEEQLQSIVYESDKTHLSRFDTIEKYMTRQTLHWKNDKSDGNLNIYIIIPCVGVICILLYIFFSK